MYLIGPDGSICEIVQMAFEFFSIQAFGIDKVFDDDTVKIYLY